MGLQETLDSFKLSNISKHIPTLLIGDSIQIMKTLPANSVDLIYDDTPYTDLDLHREQGTTTRLSKSAGSSMEWYDTITYEKILPLYNTLLKSGQHIYFWRPSINEGSWKNWSDLLDYRSGYLKSNGMVLRKVLPCPKPYPGMGYSWKSQHESVIFVYKNGNFRQLNNYSLSDVLDGENWLHPRSPLRIHDSEKPLSVAEKVILNSTNEGEIVLESFAGSFGTGRVNYLKQLKRRVLGIEKESRIVDRLIEHCKENKIEMNVIDFRDMEKKC